VIQKWTRYSELLCAVWLVVSGWVLTYPEPFVYRVVSITAAVAIIIFDIMSITLFMRYAYLMILVVAAALLGFAYFIAPAETQGTQNLICVALFLLMFAILPTEALKPPKSWRDFHGEDAMVDRTAD
jgi:hypothetical protein